MNSSFYQRHYSKIMLGSALFGAFSGYYVCLPLVCIALFVSKLFVNMLELLSVPLIFLSIVATISGMKSFDEMRLLGKKVLKYTLLTTIVSATIGLLLFLLINPASVIDVMSQTTSHGTSATGSYVSFISNMIPSNIVKLFGENGNVTAIVFFALLVSFAILKLPKENKSFLHKLFSSLFATMLQIAHFVILLLPIGVFGFVTQLFYNLKTQQGDLSHLMWYSVCVLLANVVQGVIVLPTLLWYKGISPFTYFKHVSEALTMAFLSKSSNTALPLSLSCATKRAGISERVASFTLPLCSTINMNGCAAFMLITVLFVSMSHGMTFSLFEMIMWIFIVTAAAVGNAGVPMGCYFLASAFLTGMDVPLYLLGAILPLYTFFDMVETALNVWSDLVVAAVVDKELAQG